MPPPRTITREVFALAWPATLQGVMQTVIFFVDRIMLGRHSDHELAALMVSGILLWSITSIFGAWTVGTLAAVARSKGAGEDADLREHVATSLLLSIAVGSAVAIVGNLIAAPLIGAFGVEASVARAGEGYLRLLLWVTPLTFVGLTLMSAFTGAGDTRTPMLASGVATAVNIVGNYLLIYGRGGFPELGIQGAAIASAVAYATLAVVLLGATLRPATVLSTRPADLLRPSRASLVHILRVSLPAAGERGVFHLGFVLFSRIVTVLGTPAMAAHEALIALQSIVFLPGEGFGTAAGSIMGRALGAGRPHDAKRGGRIATYMVAVPLVATGILFAAAPDLLVGLFSDDPEVVALGATALLIGAFEGIFLGSFQVLSGGLRGAGDTRSPLLATTVGIWVVRLPLCALFALSPEQSLGLGLGLGLWGVWLGTLLDWLVRAVMMTVVFQRGRWMGQPEQRSHAKERSR